MKRFVLTFACLASLTSVANAKILCGSKSQDVKYFEVDFTGSGAILKFRDLSCKTSSIPYNPRVPKYKGWERTAPARGEDCGAFAKAIADATGIEWLSFDPKIRDGNGEGFAQLGTPNNADPGSGSVSKSDVRCFTAK